MDWSNAGELRRRFEKTGFCDNCGNSGLLLSHVIMFGTASVHGYPCTICGNKKGWIEFVTARYKRGLAQACNHSGNLYIFPSDLRQLRIAIEAENIGIVIKSVKCDNVIPFRKPSEP
jgi:hypothetical protein